METLLSENVSNSEVLFSATQAADLTVVDDDFDSSTVNDFDEAESDMGSQQHYGIQYHTDVPLQPLEHNYNLQGNTSNMLEVKL